MVFLILRVMFMRAGRSSFLKAVMGAIVSVDLNDADHLGVSFDYYFVQIGPLPTHVVRCKFCRLPFPVIMRELFDELPILGQEGAEVRLDASAVRLDLLT